MPVRYGRVKADPCTHRFTPKDRKAFRQFAKVMAKRLKKEEAKKAVEPQKEPEHIGFNAGEVHFMLPLGPDGKLTPKAAALGRTVLLEKRS